MFFTKKNEIKSVSYAAVNEIFIDFDALSQKQRKEYVSKIIDNVGKAVSEYLSTHSDEAESFRELV